MKAHPPPLEKLIRKLSKLPGLGEKSATRIAMHLLRASREDVDSLAEALKQIKTLIRTCGHCYHFTDGEVCAICADPQRANGVLCVVESTADLVAIEQSGAFQGRYHVLQGVLAPLDGVGPDQLRIKELLQRLEPEGIQEVILATNPSMEGEATAQYLSPRLRAAGVRVTRLARGLPVGGDL
ncbi:MAG TPA: recombination protein RecR, partial [Syntrophobacteraceae bacterium]|nr:recombination protein RecR [Syntrophobacteraceae bacterium]